MLWIVIILVVLLVALAIIYPVTRFSRFKQTQKEAIATIEERIRKRGEPVDLASLSAMQPQIPDSENGAIALMTLWGKSDPDRWESFRMGRQSLPEKTRPVYDPELPLLGANGRNIPRNTPLSESQKNAAESFVRDLAPHMIELRSALNFQRFQFPLIFTNAYALLLPHLVELRHEANQVRIAAWLALESGDIDTFLDHETLLVRIISVPENEPVLISQLVRLSCSKMFLTDLERAFSRTNLTSVQMDRIASLLAQLPSDDIWARTLMWERPMTISISKMSGAEIASFGNSSDDTSSKLDVQGLNYGWKAFDFSGIRDADYLYMLETFEKAAQLATNRDSDSIFETDRLFASATNAFQFPPKIMSAMMLPPLSKARMRFASFEAERRAAELALAVERFRNSNSNELPANIEDLCPTFLEQIPMDPLDETPMKFAKKEVGYVIYSVGPDQNDDGGLERGSKTRSQSYDLTFTVER